MLRIVTASVLAPLLWVLIKLTPEWCFFLFGGLVILGACWEGFRLMEARGARPFVWAGMLAVIAIAWSFRSPALEALVPVVGVSLLAMLLAMWRRDTPGEMLDAWLGTVFPVLFIGLALTYLLALRRMPGEDGEDLVLLLFLCVIFADTSAYYVGSSIGKHRMAPVLSPKKSWEGAAGALAGSVLAAVIAHLWFYQRLPWYHALILGLVLAVAGMVGDLAESAVKRAAGRKDSSGLLPGHGGILDRMDSLLFSAPVLYYYYGLFLKGMA